LIMGDLTVIQRQEIARLYSKGVSFTTISKRFGVTPKTASNWANRGEDSSETFEDAPRSGRPSTLTKAEHSCARRMALAGKTAQQVAGRLSKNRQQPVSAATVVRTLAAGKDPLLWVPVNRGRVLSQKNKGLRAKFCADSKRKQCGAWVYGDSKFYYMYKDGAGRVRWKWQNMKEMQTVLSSGSPVVLHFYGFVAKGYKSKLYFVAPTAPAGSKARKGRESYASKHFIELLPKVKRDLQRGNKYGARHPLVLDRAKQHVSAASKAAIQAVQLHLVDDFPAQSWDINIIENVWGVVDGKLKAMGGPFPRCPDGWRRRVKRAWDDIDQATIDKLIDAVPDRMASIEQQEGEWLFRKCSKK
jgi:transposase